MERKEIRFVVSAKDWADGRPRYLEYIPCENRFIWGTHHVEHAYFFPDEKTAEGVIGSCLIDRMASAAVLDDTARVRKIVLAYGMPEEFGAEAAYNILKEAGRSSHSFGDDIRRAEEREHQRMLQEAERKVCEEKHCPCHGPGPMPPRREPRPFPPMGRDRWPEPGCMRKDTAPMPENLADDEHLGFISIHVLFFPFL